MTNTESRTVSLEELAPWDDADTLEHGTEQITEEDVRELAAYGFDSDHRTLVGLGPVERARRARQAAEVPDSQRMPQSEPPGPFIVDDVDDDELLRSLRPARLGPWVVAVPVALVLAAAAVAVVRGFAAPVANNRPVSANARPAIAAPPPKVEAVGTDATREPALVEGSSTNEQAGETEQGGETERAERLDVARSSATVKVPLPAAPLPVTLPEQSPSTVAVVPPSVADTRVGSLNVTSSPPANVLLDGRPLGQAPRLVQVPPGKHTVLFIHPLYGRRALSVHVSAGQTTTASADF